jgi:hypothetical protein
MAFIKNKLNLVDIFNAALKAVSAKREDINALDTLNNNHGDNMVQNLKIIRDALTNSQGESPAAALLDASRLLNLAGKGGTSQYYAQGLYQIADLFKGRDALDPEDGMALVETLMSAIPAEGHPGAGENISSVLDMMATLSGQQSSGVSYTEEMGDIGELFEVLSGAMGSLDEGNSKESGMDMPGDILDMIQGLMSGEDESVESGGFDLRDIIKQTLPAGMDLLVPGGQAGDKTAGRIDLLRTLFMGNPSHAQTPREGAAKVIGESILQYLLKLG